MLIMSVDAALKRCSVAVVHKGESLSVQIEDREKGHAERIAPMAEAALKEAGVKPLTLDRIGVVVGPGGFTGVRVGLSFARAFGLAAGADVLGIVSLDALAAGLGSVDGDVAALVDARRGQVYACLYRDNVRLIDPFVATPAEAVRRLSEKARDNTRMVGDGAAIIEAPADWSIGADETQINPLVVARLAASAPVPDGPPAPLYLRSPDARPPAPMLARS